MTDSDQEKRRLNALREYNIMDTDAESDFDNITQIASQICGTPISIISLIDDQRQWFKSHLGVENSETPRDQAFCAHAIEKPDEVMVVENPVDDPRFRDNPLVTGDPRIRFYAGAPLVNTEGFALGTLCVIDRASRTLSEQQLHSLRALANQVMAQLELRKKIRELEQINHDIDEYAHVVSHDLKSPVNTLISLVDLFKATQAARLDDKGNGLLLMMEQRVNHLKKLIVAILDYSLPEPGNTTLGWIDLNTLLPQIISDLPIEDNVTIRLQDQYPLLWMNDTCAEQIFQNLLMNAIKYNDKDQTLIEVTAHPLSDTQWEVTVADNGLGIEEKFFSEVFKPFKTLNNKDRYGQSGTGIGLATVKKLVTRSGGDIRIESTPDQGSKFILTLEGKSA